MSGLYIYLYFPPSDIGVCVFSGLTGTHNSNTCRAYVENGENGMHTLTAVNLRLSPVCLSIFPCDQG